jgi:predicted nucleotidyltransferase component of viral defense system
VTVARPPDLDPVTAANWATQAHAYVLDALMTESSWRCNDIAFHGGTSLHLSWRSPRFSEDLDFLIARDVADVAKVMKAVTRRVQERFALVDPTITVDSKDKTRDAERMPYYQVSVTSSARTGKAMVKVEFWRVDRSYLESYPTEFRTPMVVGDLVSSVLNPVPAARLSTAFCDKLVAFATRPRLKSRDVFDLWWIGTQTPEPLDLKAVTAQFLHNVTAYEVRDGMTPAGALRQFMERDDEDIFDEVGRDLQQWLPETLWRLLYPKTVREMVAYVRHALTAVADNVEAIGQADAPSVLKAAPR